MTLKDLDTKLQQEAKASEKRILIALGIIFSVITIKFVFGLVAAGLLLLSFLAVLAYIHHRKHKKWLEADIKAIAAQQKAEQHKNIN